MKLLVLVGLPGSGKTSIGYALAKLGYTFLKIDDYYAQTPRQDLSVEWHQDKGYIAEAYARFKKDILAHVQHDTTVVVESTGVSPRFNSLIEEVRSLANNLKVARVYLHIDPELAWQRVTTRNATDYPIKMERETFDHFTKKLAEIEAHYDVRVNADQTVENVCNTVIRLVK